jgi:predicted pyridoxine 5'-phosphate oxidase superfamily flavin-nucleotide-binding protein
MKEGAETERYASDVAFSASVKATQARKGSRQAYAAMEQNGSWQTRITPDLAAFIEAQTSVFLATASKDGQPYIQHRGGPAGFLKVLDEKTIVLPISRATGNMSLSAISPRIRRRIFS